MLVSTFRIHFSEFCSGIFKQFCNFISLSKMCAVSILPEEFDIVQYQGFEFAEDIILR